LPHQQTAATKHLVPDGEAVAARARGILLVDSRCFGARGCGSHIARRKSRGACGSQPSRGAALLGEHEFDAIVADSEVRASNGAENLQDWLTANNPELAGG